MQWRDWLLTMIAAPTIMLIIERFFTRKRRRAEHKSLLIKNELELEKFKNEKIVELEEETEMLKKAINDMTQRYSRNVDLFIQKIRELEDSNRKLIEMIEHNKTTIKELRNTINDSRKEE